MNLGYLTAINHEVDIFKIIGEGEFEEGTMIFIKKN